MYEEVGGVIAALVAGLSPLSVERLDSRISTGTAA